MRLIYLPLENLHERYTVQLNAWVAAACQRREIDCLVIPGTALRRETPPGQFLDWPSRVHFCATQLETLAAWFAAGKIHEDDCFLLADFWHLGLESLAYLRDLMGIEFRLYAIQHAGPFDPTDLTHGLGLWARYQEAAWYLACDAVFVGSEFLAQTIRQGLAQYGLPGADRLRVMGLPWDANDVARTPRVGDLRRRWSLDDRPIIVWPHRLSPEKRVDRFYAIVQRCIDDDIDAQWIITSGRTQHCYQPTHPAVRFLAPLHKIEYYALLRIAHLMLSTADHENFGYTIREATALGCPILCPYQACYPEMVLSHGNLYTSDAEAVAKIGQAIRHELRDAILKPNGGIDAMLDIMGFSETE